VAADLEWAKVAIAGGQCSLEVRTRPPTISGHPALHRYPSGPFTQHPNDVPHRIITLRYLHPTSIELQRRTRVRKQWTLTREDPGLGSFPPSVTLVEDHQFRWPGWQSGRRRVCGKKDRVLGQRQVADKITRYQWGWALPVPKG